MRALFRILRAIFQDDGAPSIYAGLVSTGRREIR